MKYFWIGFKAMLPITTGVVPFGIVMGTIYAEANVEPIQAIFMNLFVFAGASQLAAIDLMTKDAESIVIILTGLIMNMRMMLYSAALSPQFKQHSLFIKLLGSYCLTDQSYAVMIANSQTLPGHTKPKSPLETLHFYFGASFIMILAWQFSVIAGFIFGNFAPTALSLDFAVPLGFMALVLPTIRNKKYLTVAITSTVLSVILYKAPYNLGLLITACSSLALATFITRKKQA